jgi:hypothetical protein
VSHTWIAPADDPALAAARRRYGAALEALSPLLAKAGQNLLDRVSTAHWLLEWNLPRWLGASFGLEPGVTGELVLGNTFGLACTRLLDDLADGEAVGERRELVLLAAALHSLWLMQYVPLFEAASPFWDHLRQFQGQWLRATLGESRPDGGALRVAQAEALQHLAERGAPLKAGCVAACLLAGRGAHITPLAAGIDAWLAGAVLVDHADDWQADLEAGRPNAFVAFFAAPQGAHSPDADRQAVLEELYLGAAARPYFELAQEQFRRARETVRPVGCPELEAYLAWAEAQAARYAGELEQELRRRLRSAAEALLRPGSA